jgi:hypothetical protein
MTMSLIAGEEPIGQLATTLGWSNTVDYVETLPQVNYANLKEFVDEGYCEKLDLLQSEAEAAAKQTTDKGVKDVLENLVKLLKSTNEDFVIID